MQEPWKTGLRLSEGMVSAVETILTNIYGTTSTQHDMVPAGVLQPLGALAQKCVAVPKLMLPGPVRVRRKLGLVAATYTRQDSASNEPQTLHSLLRRHVCFNHGRKTLAAPNEATHDRLRQREVDYAKQACEALHLRRIHELGKLG